MVWPTDKISQPFGVLRSQACLFYFLGVLINDNIVLLDVNERDRSLATEHIGLILNTKSNTDPKFFNTVKILRMKIMFFSNSNNVSYTRRYKGKNLKIIV